MMGRRNASSAISTEQLGKVVKNVKQVAEMAAKEKAAKSQHPILIGEMPTRKNQLATSLDPYAVDCDPVDVGMSKESKDVVTKRVR